MAMEGMPLTNEDKCRLRDIFDGNTTVEQTVQELIRKHIMQLWKNDSCRAAYMQPNDD